jgi:hypothetical protein
MHPKDVRKCVEHIAVHPVLGPRYGKLIGKLPAAIRSTLSNAPITTISDEFQGSTTRRLGATMGLFRAWQTSLPDNSYVDGERVTANRRCYMIVSGGSQFFSDFWVS